MRSRLVLLISLALACGLVAAPVATAASLHLAQAESEEGPGEEGGEGQPDAETGAGEDEQGAAAEEEGPQWTYQMSKITLVMLLLLFLAMGALYYRMIARRQRGV